MKDNIKSFHSLNSLIKVETEFYNKVMDSIDSCRGRITMAQVDGIFALISKEMFNDHINEED